MKYFISILLFVLVITATGFAQNKSSKLAFLIDAVTLPNHQTGNTNYVLSLSDEDLKSQKCIIYTDSNTTVAYVSINGNIMRLTGGPNPENILAYTSKRGYTITLCFKKNIENTVLKNTDDYISVKTEATLVIANKAGQVIVKPVSGAKINAVRK